VVRRPFYLRHFQHRSEQADTEAEHDGKNRSVWEETMNALRVGWLITVAGTLVCSCLPLVDGSYVGDPLVQFSGTVDFVDGLPDLFEQQRDFDLALIWRHPAQDAPFVSVSRSEGRATSSAGTFTMDVFSLPPFLDGRWSGRLFAFVPYDGSRASWSEGWNTFPDPNPRPYSVSSCSNVFASPDVDGDGLPNSSESDVAGDTSPTRPDSDDDGICDGPNTVAGVCTGNPESEVAFDNVDVDSMDFVELAEDDPAFASWQSCVDAAADRFVECERTADTELSGCESRWRTERIECGDTPVAAGIPVFGPLNLRCRFSVEEVPSEISVERPVGDDASR
jgi:hypothetical protein